MSKETIPVRQGEELNEKRLERFLRDHFDLENAPLEIEQFANGHSNLTYLIRVGAWEAVLRRPPLGPTAPKAHDMGREYQVLKRLHPAFPLAPKPLVFCDDPEIVGAPFFMMERRKGVVVETSLPPDIPPTPEKGRQLSELMVDALVELHAIPYKEAGMVQISRPSGFLTRQVEGWIHRFHRSKTEEIKELDSLSNYLTSRIPASPEPTVIHYDYKFNNVMFDPGLTKMVGIFDWEMATVGDPLADLGCTMSYWIEESDPDFLKKAFGRDPVTVLPGFFTRKQFLECYGRKSGQDLSTIHYYLTFAYFKLAVICQQIYYRYQKGQTADERFAKMGELAKALIRFACQHANGHQ
ncbi:MULTISPECIES: phosphotransferase family protein [unclassified Thermoactinomyces]|uniref:phosphotransferase family protein n=2 Tax=Thermoactinomyces TaxID=2023 RepID=UPI0018DD2623|nr:MULTISPECIES: phosphotransferase family protein [unclassified Thermoactinomyces]MBH8599185.1 phosphotransferase family protein [Thermoactinomyces sp. CICC 10523]MBH8605394.1 phosphotransferase family protein [Thermoactinomyces sp. CICC 10522]